LPRETRSTPIVHRTTCRVCDSSDLDPILSFGPTPLAKAFLRSPEEFAAERSYPWGTPVAGCGARAKRNTLLNFCRIDTRLVRYAVDNSPRKVGLFTPGAHLPVLDVSARSASQTAPDHLMMLQWNLDEEIMQEQRAYRDRGGQFIPVPRARVA
jgi:hypothetical protein